MNRYGENDDEVLADIDGCSLCDEHGRRRGMPCDHIDHETINRRGMAKVREAMGWT